MEGLRTIADLRREPDFGWHDGDELDNWLITPFGRSRDSDHLTVSNHETVVKLLEAAEAEAGEEADDYRVLHFGHWACGWLDQVIVRPGSKCADVIEEQMRRYGNYPVLDEEDFSNREWEDYHQSWTDYGAGDFRAELGKVFDWDDGLEHVRDMVEEADRELLREFYEELRPSGEYCIHESGGCSFRHCIEAAVELCTRDNLAAFVRKLRNPPPAGLMD